ncbi:Translation initiation factor IF-2 [Larimichthys crocea]|nr:Translation initiation factor IF-2 [Larimichthys crocea]
MADCGGLPQVVQSFNRPETGGPKPGGPKPGGPKPGGPKPGGPKPGGPKPGGPKPGGWRFGASRSETRCHLTTPPHDHVTLRQLHADVFSLTYVSAPPQCPQLV